MVASKELHGNMKSSQMNVMVKCTYRHYILTYRIRLIVFLKSLIDKQQALMYIINIDKQMELVMPVKLNDILERSSLNEEEKTRGMKASGNDFKSIRHINNYVVPMLSKAGQQNTFNNIKKFDVSANKRVAQNGPQMGQSHNLHIPFNGHAAGTAIKIKHVFHDKATNTFHAATEKHGDIPLSKIRVPQSLAKKNITETGFNVERTISHNLGTAPAGSSTKGFDYSKRFDNKHHLKGVVNHPEKEDKETYSHGDLKGESKLLKGNFGTSAVVHNKQTKTWSMTNEKMKSKFGEATHPTSGLPLLAHLNKYHANGKINNGFQMKPAQGTAMHYLKTSGVNSLHAHEIVHEKVKNAEGKKEKTGKIIKDVGTTYTFGRNNPLNGKSRLAHLHDSEIHKIDGALKIEATKNGTTRVSHSPNQAHMKNLANRSVTHPENHRSLYIKDHAHEFIKHVSQHLAKKPIREERLPRFAEAFMST